MNTLIQNEEQYQAALKKIRELGEPGPGTQEYKQAESLTAAIMQYEQYNYPPETLSPNEAERIRKEVLTEKTNPA